MLNPTATNTDPDHIILLFTNVISAHRDFITTVIYRNC